MLKSVMQPLGMLLFSGGAHNHIDLIFVREIK